MNIYIFVIVFFQRNSYIRFIRKLTNIAVLVKCYSEWMIQIYKKFYSEMIMMRKELEQ